MIQSGFQIPTVFLNFQTCKKEAYKDGCSKINKFETTNWVTIDKKRKTEGKTKIFLENEKERKVGEERKDREKKRRKKRKKRKGRKIRQEREEKQEKKRKRRGGRELRKERKGR